MGVLDDLLRKLGYGGGRAHLRVFLLDDDARRHDWFAQRFRGDHLDVAAEPARAIKLLSENSYDAIFLDHDLLPEHYESDERDDERTGYAVALWLAERPDRQSASHIIVHTRNADAALRMVELLRRTGRHAEHVPFQHLTPKIKSYWSR